MSTPSPAQIDRRGVAGTPPPVLVRVPAPSRRTRWSIGRLLPVVLGVWAALDVLPRFGPLEWLELDPVQIAQRTPGRYSPFKANLRLQAPYVGTEARMANIRPEEFRAPITFTTDELGFRWSPYAADREVAAVVLGGFSFTFGSALSDDETFPSVLGSTLGVRTYNAGRFQRDPESLTEIDWLLEKIGPGVKTAVYVYADGAPVKPEGRPSEEPEPYLQSAYAYAERYVRGWRLVSPLEILSIRAYKSMANGYALPNEYIDKVVMRHLPSGDRALLWKHEIEAYQAAPDQASAAGQAEYVAWWRDTLKSRGIDMSVLLVPTKTEVYAPWLLNDVPRPKQSFLDVFQQELEQRGLAVVNGLTELRQFAEQDIAGGTLSFYREDGHWNPQGVLRLANATAESLRRSGWQPSSDLSTAVR